jgi:predicted ATPase
VFFVDDLQWAGRTPLGLFDLALAEEPIEGLLLVGAYREDDVNAAHPLAALLSRWREAAGAREMRLANLSVSGFVAMVAEMLHVDQAPAAELTEEVIAPHTGGNPYDTAELLNALRRDGLLATTAAGSQWDVAAVRAAIPRNRRDFG